LELDGNNKPDDTSNKEDDDGQDEQARKGRTAGRDRSLTNERGGFPDGLSGVKEEEMPGPMNKIVLEPRIAHIHVSVSVAGLFS
jgi:hypothetical protein